MRKKEDRSEKEKVDYTELNKNVKKKRSQRSRKKQTDHVETYFKVVEDQNIYTKEEQRQRYVK